MDVKIDINNMMRAIVVGSAVLFAAFSALPASAATPGHQLQIKEAVFDDATPADPAPADPAPADPAPDPAPQGN